MSPRLEAKYAETHGCTISRDSGSGSPKLQGILATYASLTTCSRACHYRQGGCYAKHGKCGMVVRRLALASVTPDMVARYEASLIARSKSTLPLRIHVAGDCGTDKRAKVLSHEAEQYMQRTGKPGWTYTHSWRKVSRESWGSVSVLASCHNMRDVVDATARGYACALVITHYNAPTFKLPGGFTAVVCPSFTRGAGCASCAGKRTLCTNDSMLREKKLVVCLEVHGAGASKASKFAYNPDTDNVEG